MKGSKAIISQLNLVLTRQLTMINQHFLHARILKDWGYEKPASEVYKYSISEMKMAQNLIDRILLIKGLPNLQRLGRLTIGEKAEEQLELERKAKEVSIEQLKETIELCLKEDDHATRVLVEEFLAKEEDMLDWFETQVSLIKDVGLEQYLAESMG